MTMLILGAFALAFLISFALGMRFIPWLRKHNASQPLKKEVEEIIYAGNNDSTSLGI